MGKSLKITFWLDYKLKGDGIIMANVLQKWLQKFIKNIFNKKKDVRLGLYGRLMLEKPHLPTEYHSIG
jgi:hypothetical protein